MSLIQKLEELGVPTPMVQTTEDNFRDAKIDIRAALVSDGCLKVRSPCTRLRRLVKVILLNLS